MKMEKFRESAKFWPLYYASNTSLQLQNWGYIHATASVRSTGITVCIDKQNRGVGIFSRRETFHDSRRNGAAQGPAICQIWKKHKSGDLIGSSVSISEIVSKILSHAHTGSGSSYGGSAKIPGQRG